MTQGSNAPSNECNGLRGRVLVVGGGTMGSGIAHSFLRAGYDVALVEVDEDAAQRARLRVLHLLDDAREERIAPRFAVASDWPTSIVTLAIEAVPEAASLKHTVLKRIAECVPSGTVIATNTSALSVSELASHVRGPERFLGMHFFNPVAKSAMVEVVVGRTTAPDTVASATGYVRSLDKEPIVVTDAPGFATSRLGVSMGLEAIRMLEEGVASAEDIDRAMVLGYRLPIGPLRLTDLVGLDIRLAIADYLAVAIGDRFAPPQLLRQKVASGHLGKKAGIGFFKW